MMNNTPGVEHRGHVAAGGSDSGATEAQLVKRQLPHDDPIGSNVLVNQRRCDWWHEACKGITACVF